VPSGSRVITQGTGMSADAACARQTRVIDNWRAVQSTIVFSITATSCSRTRSATPSSAQRDKSTIRAGKPSARRQPQSAGYRGAGPESQAGIGTGTSVRALGKSRDQVSESSFAGGATLSTFVPFHVGSFFQRHSLPGASVPPTSRIGGLTKLPTRA